MSDIGVRIRMKYERPAVTTFATAEVIEALGPAQGLASSVDGPPGLGGPMPGITSSVSSSTTRRYGKR